MNELRKSSVSSFFTLFLFCCCVVSIAQCQSNGSAEVANALAKLRSGEFTLYDLGLIGEARVVEAIPDLERQFTLKSDTLEKAKIAQVLLQLGDRKQEYWSYLADTVNAVLESDAPSPVRYDAAGMHIKGPSPEFIAWAQRHGQSPDQAAEEAVYRLPGLVMILGMSGDSRAVPLLRRGLSSPNYHIVAAAALGLAEMRDQGSVALIVSRCKEAPVEAASGIAQSLVYFDGPEAQGAVDTFIRKEKAKMLRDARAAGDRPLHKN